MKLAFLDVMRWLLSGDFRILDSVAIKLVCVIAGYQKRGTNIKINKD